MANPFLVLGGIAVGIVVASMGVLQVPGWVKSAQDASAINDLASAVIGEAAAGSQGLGYMNGAELGANAHKIGASFNLSGGVKVCITRNTAATAFAAVALSPSGAFFARTADSTKAKEAASASAALTAAGGLPEGVPTPVIDGDCAPDAELVGDNGGDGGNGGDGVGGGSVVAPQALGEKVNLGQPTAVAHTSYGTFTLQMGEPGPLIRSSEDGTAHTFTSTDAETGEEVQFEYYSGLASDSAGNLYAMSKAVPQDSAGHWSGVQNRRLPYRIAPDGTATKLWHPDSSYDGDYTPPQAISVAPNGTVYVSMAGWASSGQPDGIYRLVGGKFQFVAEAPLDHIAVDATENVYFIGEADAIFRASKDGKVTRLTAADEVRSTGQFGVTADGTVYTGDGNTIYKVSAAGESAAYLTSYWQDGFDNFWAGIQGLTVASDGTIYFSDSTMTDSVYKLAPGATDMTDTVLVMR